MTFFVFYGISVDRKAEAAGLEQVSGGEKKNRRNPAEFQRFSLVQNGGRSRTRIYDLHDVNVAL